MNAHISTMHYPSHHRQPQDRPISLVGRLNESSRMYFKGDATSFSFPQMQPGYNTPTSKSAGITNPAASLPQLCDFDEKSKHLGRMTKPLDKKIDEKAEVSSFVRSELNRNVDHNGYGQRIPTPCISPRDHAHDSSNRTLYIHRNQASNNNGRAGSVTSPSFDQSLNYTQKGRRRTHSSSFSSQPSLVYSDAGDSHMSSCQNTPVPSTANEEYFNTPSDVGQHQMYSPLHAITTPKNTDSPTGQYYFTPQQSMDSTMAMTPRLSHYSSDMSASKHLPTHPSSYNQRHYQLPPPQCTSTPYLTPVEAKVEHIVYTHRQQQEASPRQPGSSSGVTSVSNFYCQPITHRSQPAEFPENPHTLINQSEYDRIEFPPLPSLPTVVSSSTINSCSKSPQHIETPSSVNAPPMIPQSFKNDVHRQKKVKTELCKYYLNGSVSKCPFGSKCNYAHGEKELKYSTLHEMKHAGLVEDVNIYRTHPCFSFVSAGACPFGLRCNGIHDPRMNSTASSWLPHSDTPVNNLKTDLNVDTSYHINLAALHQSNPFAHDLIWDHRPSLVVGYKERKKEVKAKNDGISTPSTVIDCMRADSDNNDDWADTYALVCNMANFKGESRSTKDRRFSKKSFGFVNSNRMVISELQKLSIAVIMSYNKKTEEGGERLLSSPHREYIYKPMALVYNELCMILQERYFQLLNTNLWKDAADKICEDSERSDKMDTIPQYIVREVSKVEYTTTNRRPKICDMIVVREIAFGSIGEVAAKTSIWYDIPNNAVKSCTVQEVKRYKRERQRNNYMQQQNPTSQYPTQYKKNDAASKYVPFPGSDKITQSSFLSHPHKPFFHMQPLSGDPTLYNFIHSLLYHRIRVLALREVGKAKKYSNWTHIQRNLKKQLKEVFTNVVRDTNAWKWPVTAGREITSEHTPVPMCETNYKPFAQSCGDFLPIWNGLWQSLNSAEHGDELSTNKDDIAKKIKSRCIVFSKLADGEYMNHKDRSLPNLKKTCETKKESSMAWKSILVKPDVFQNSAGWQLIMEHYQEKKYQTTVDN